MMIMQKMFESMAQDIYSEFTSYTRQLFYVIWIMYPLLWLYMHISYIYIIHVGSVLTYELTSNDRLKWNRNVLVPRCAPHTHILYYNNIIIIMIIGAHPDPYECPRVSSVTDSLRFFSAILFWQYFRLADVYRWCIYMIVIYMWVD